MNVPVTEIIKVTAKITKIVLFDSPIIMTYFSGGLMIWMVAVPDGGFSSNGSKSLSEDGGALLLPP